MSQMQEQGSLSALSVQENRHTLTERVHMIQLRSNVDLLLLVNAPGVDPSNACIFETDDGVVLFDVGFRFSGPQILRELRKITDQLVRYIIYGHGHVDHAGGTQAILDEAQQRGDPRPLIVAHSNLPRRFDRYQYMSSYQNHINRIQFAIPEFLPEFAKIYIYPDVTYDVTIQFRLGGITFLLFHAMGETDDHTWMWVPEKRVAAVSDLWAWFCPIIGNPFKIQRYEIEWAEALEAIAGREPEILLPGHGLPISGMDKIRDACTTVALALRYLHDQVIAMLNQGKWPEEILHTFDWPEEFKNSPYLRPIYGHPYFIVKDILRRYHGWFDGNPTNLFPSRYADVAREMVELLGNTEILLNRARELQAREEEQLALHLVDVVIHGGSGVCRAEALGLKVNLLKFKQTMSPT